MTKQCNQKEMLCASFLDELQRGWRSGKDITSKTKQALRSRYFGVSEDLPNGTQSLRSVEKTITRLRKKLGIVSKRVVVPFVTFNQIATDFPKPLKLVYNSLSNDVRSALDQSGLSPEKKERVLLQFNNFKLPDEGKKNVIFSAVSFEKNCAEQMTLVKLGKAQRRRLRNFLQQEANQINERNATIDRFFMRLSENTKKMNIDRLKLDLEDVLMAVYTEDVSVILNAIKNHDNNSSGDITHVADIPLPGLNILPAALPLYAIPSINRWIDSPDFPIPFQ